MTVGIARMPAPSPVPVLRVAVHTGAGLTARLPELTRFAFANTPAPLSRHPGWLTVLHEGLGHEVYALEATTNGAVTGYLPLAFLRSLLFGRFLVSLPYLNSNGVVASSPDVAEALIAQSVKLAETLRVRYLELRHEQPIEHPALTKTLSSKVHMRLVLPTSTEALWKGFDAKVRNQVRKAEKHDLRVTWGGDELLEPFFAVLAENMRDLGTPVYGQRLFREILRGFPEDSELCVVRTPEGKPIAAAMLLHGPGITEVPTASSLRAFNATCANMLMYRHLLDRAVNRGQTLFDFGRSTVDGSTFRFKKQWGAEPHPANWQYYERSGTVGEMRPDNPRYQRMIRTWQRLPVWATRLLGPAIVRGIP